MEIQSRDRHLGNGVEYDAVGGSEEQHKFENQQETKQNGTGRLLVGKVSNSVYGVLRHSRAKFLFVAAVGLSIILLVRIILLVLLERRRDNVTCNDPRFRKKKVPYPDLNFKEVKRLEDNGRHSLVKAENWVVISVNEAPTDTVKAMVANLHEWQVLAIGEIKAPKDWAVKGAIFLSTEQQATLGYRIQKFMPYNSYVRKSIGYLFSIQHGAKRIYDADSRSSLMYTDLGKMFDLNLSSPKPILQYRSLSNRTVVNPFIHYGQRAVWPRGLSLTSVPKIYAEIFYDQVPGGTHFIQQGLINGLPDIDSVFYHTRRLGDEPINIQFDSLAPPLAIPAGTMAPINCLNTLFHYPAFWALMLPVSKNFETADVVRGYWSQRLLWELGGLVAVYPPSVNRFDTMQAPSSVDEDDLVPNWEELTSFLISWKSTKHSRSFFRQVLHLSYGMARKGFWSGQDVELTAAWLLDLVAVGYSQPKLQPSSLNHNKDTTLSSKKFIPHIFPSIYPGIEEASAVEKEMGNLLRWRGFFDNMVLVLECSMPRNHSILAWRMLYGRLFRQVVILSEQADPALHIEAGAGDQTYRALPGIIEKYPNADGYLVAKEHVILNYWNMFNGNRSKLWALHQMEASWKTVMFNDSGKEWYMQTGFKSTVQNALSKLPEKFKTTYIRNMGEERFVFSTSDIFFIPQHRIGDFLDLASVAFKAKVRHELAIPLIFLAMDSVEEFDKEALSKALYLNDASRMEPSTLYSPDWHIVYPWKAKTEAEFFHIIKSMAMGDPLLLTVL